MAEEPSTPDLLQARVRELERRAAELEAALEAERRRMSQSRDDLEDARLLLEAVVEQCPVPLAVARKRDLAVLYTNRAALEMLGLDERSVGSTLPEIMRDQTWQDFLPDGTRLEFGDLPLARALRGESTRNLELRVVRQDGSERWELVNGTPVYDRTGQLAAGLIAFPDITERKEAEAKTQRFQQQLEHLATQQRVILSTATVGIASVKGRVVQWANTALARMFGYQENELCGAAESRFYATQDDYQRVGREQAVLATGAAYTTELPMRRKDGSVFWCGITGRAICPSNLDQGAIWVLQDITERRAAGEALRESEERFKRLVQNSNDMITVTDENARVLSVSSSVEPLLGYHPSELVGTNGFELIHPDDLESVSKAFADALAHPGSLRRVEYRFRHKNGPWIPVEVVGTSWLHDPVVRGVVLNVREISERKDAEKERTKLQQQLLHAMKMEAVGRLAGGIAHDFNNLLTAISGNLELLKLDLEHSDPLMVNVEEASKAADSATALTRQLLAFSRRQIIEPKVLNLNELVENLRRMLVRVIGEDVTLSTRLDPELGATRIDPGQFEQLLVNLSVNARDAMPNGGQLVIETSNIELDDQYARQHPHVRAGAYVMLAVSDTGCGMDDAVRQHVFEPFFTTKPKGRGTGLGLATIFGTVKQAQGSIEVYSEVGKGTTFKVYLPRAQEPAVSLPAARPLGDLLRGHEVVLVVEDDATVRALTQAILKRLGYLVLLAASGREALRAAEECGQKIDLLMTDVIMPEMNGRELAERLLALQPEVKVLFTSGYTENVIVHHGVVDAQMQFISKPYSVQALAAKLREVLTRPGP